MSFEAAFATFSVIEKGLPFLEAAGKEFGPFIQEEVADGKVVWADLVKCFEDVKGAVAAVKLAVTPAAKPAP